MKPVTLREQMHRLAGLARAELADRAERTAEFLTDGFLEDGSFRGRGGAGDLYYTLFAIESGLALGCELPANRIEKYLASFGDGGELDLIHLTCLIRSWVDLGGPPAELRPGLTERLKQFRSGDGGFATTPKIQSGSAYGCFLAQMACEDLSYSPDESADIARCLESLRTAQGGYVNSPMIPIATTPTTTAAMAVLTALGRPIDPISVDWLLARFDEGGGFRPAPASPLADLLSTATAVFALHAAGVDLSDMKRSCRKFVLSLQSDGGDFRPNSLDSLGDSEYTWYALLALGVLADS